jgi:hypothetical protein
MTVFSSNRSSWAGQTLGAQVIGKVQIRNAKEVFWEIASVDQHGTPIMQRKRLSKGTNCGTHHLYQSASAGQQKGVTKR